MTVKVDGILKADLGRDSRQLVKFLKENTHGGKVGPTVELFNAVRIENKNGNGKESFTWVMSTGDLDRDFEKVDVEGWNLAAFLLNPVVLWSHDRYTPAIGYAENVKADGVLSGDIVFNPKEIDPFGWGIGERVRCGSLRSGSVGFQVDEVEFTDHCANPEEKADLIYRKQTLLEFSICDVPANPFALCAGNGKSVTEELPRGKKVCGMYERIKRSLVHE